MASCRLAGPENNRIRGFLQSLDALLDIFPSPHAKINGDARNHFGSPPGGLLCGTPPLNCKAHAVGVGLPPVYVIRFPQMA